MNEDCPRYNLRKDFVNVTGAPSAVLVTCACTCGLRVQPARLARARGLHRFRPRSPAVCAGSQLPPTPPAPGRTAQLRRALWAPTGACCGCLPPAPRPRSRLLAVGGCVRAAGRHGCPHLPQGPLPAKGAPLPRLLPPPLPSLRWRSPAAPPRCHATPARRLPRAKAAARPAQPCALPAPPLPPPQAKPEVIGRLRVPVADVAKEGRIRDHWPLLEAQVRAACALPYRLTTRPAPRLLSAGQGGPWQPGGAGFGGGRGSPQPCERRARGVGCIGACIHALFVPEASALPCSGRRRASATCHWNGTLSSWRRSRRPPPPEGACRAE